MRLKNEQRIHARALNQEMINPTKHKKGFTRARSIRKKINPTKQEGIYARALNQENDQSNFLTMRQGTTKRPWNIPTGRVPRLFLLLRPKCKEKDAEKPDWPGTMLVSVFQLLRAGAGGGGGPFGQRTLPLDDMQTAKSGHGKQQIG